VPFTDVVSDVVYSAMGSDVDTVLVDGRVLLEGGKPTTLDEERILDEAQRHQTALLARCGIGA